jgi:hypothetical protein
MRKNYKGKSRKQDMNDIIMNPRRSGHSTIDAGMGPVMIPIYMKRPDIYDLRGASAGIE